MSFRNTIGLIALLGLISAATYISLGTKPVRAQSGCSVQSVSGTYGYAHTGYVVVSGNLNFFAAAGTFTADGNGGFDGIDTTSTNGVITRNRKYSGTYTVGSNCTGSLVFSSGNQVLANMDFVLTNSGKTVKFIQSDTGTIITGTAELQSSGN
jgi:hypothetical protein